MSSDKQSKAVTAEGSQTFDKTGFHSYCLQASRSPQRTSIPVIVSALIWLWSPTLVFRHFVALFAPVQIHRLSINMQQFTQPHSFAQRLHNQHIHHQLICTIHSAKTIKKTLKSFLLHQDPLNGAISFKSQLSPTESCCAKEGTLLSVNDCFLFEYCTYQKQTVFNSLSSWIISTFFKASVFMRDEGNSLE